MRFTQPLYPNADGLPTDSDGYALLELVDKHYRLPNGRPLVLKPFQRRLIIRFLETDTEGNLRFRRILLSMARQNGKSVLATVLSLYALILHSRGGSVIGIATNRESAKIVYNNLHAVVKASKPLSKILKATSSSGITNKATGNTYKIMPAKSDALQGHTISALGICDEVHIVPEELWDDMVNSAAAHSNAIIFGLTTAGDDNSTLLHRLYQEAETALDDPESTLGAFIYEGVDKSPIDNVESLLAANPMYVDRPDELVERVRTMPEGTARRYVHNRFVTGVQEAWLDTALWNQHATERMEPSAGMTFGFAIGPGWSYATVVAAKRDGASTQMQVVASLNSPTLEQLQAVADHLRKTYKNSRFVMHTRSLGDLYRYLEGKGADVRHLNNGGDLRATGLFYSLVKEGKAKHAGDAVLNHQMPFPTIKSLGDSFRLVPHKTESADAIYAAMWAVYYAHTEKEKVLQVF